ncbi:hypothetical protein G5714_004277 [Onychostoma macrolepis]|uniref:Uncharacterized protein n=1 Tax=Onychostoma macrolepis TaxID=369639 RepID=A0A7J6D4S2_9TELE|nr:hypothetical protein G5714_004277 [Onychostoma macrolepis]
MGTKKKEIPDTLLEDSTLLMNTDEECTSSPVQIEVPVDSDMNTLERKLDKRSKKDSEDDTIVGKRIRVAKHLWEDEDDDPPTAVATVSGTKFFTSVFPVDAEIPQIKEMLNRSSMHLGSPGSLPSPSNPVQIEEIVPGSGVYVSRSVWRSACQASSGTSMARILLLGVFDIETLVKSNLRAVPRQPSTASEASEIRPDNAPPHACLRRLVNRYPRDATNRAGEGQQLGRNLLVTAQVHAPVHRSTNRTLQGRARSFANAVPLPQPQSFANGGSGVGVRRQEASSSAGSSSGTKDCKTPQP